MDIKEIFALLKSHDPQERALGIGLLMKTQHPKRLRIVEQVYERESNSRTKAIATNALKTLHEERAKIEYKKYSEPRPASKKTKDGKRHDKAEDSFTKARRLMHQAHAAMIIVDYAQAQELVWEAFELDPLIMEDESYLNDAVKIFGKSKQELKELFYPKEKADESSGEITLRDIQKEVLKFCALVSMMLLIAGFFLAFTIGQRARAVVISQFGSNVNIPSWFEEAYGLIYSLNIPNVIGFAFIVFVGLVFILIPITTLIHMRVTHTYFRTIADSYKRHRWIERIAEFRMYLPVFTFIIIASITYGLYSDYSLSLTYLSSTGNYNGEIGGMTKGIIGAIGFIAIVLLVMDLTSDERSTPKGARRGRRRWR